MCQINILSLYQDCCHLFNGSLILEAIPIVPFLSVEVVTAITNHKKLDKMLKCDFKTFVHLISLPLNDR